MTASSLLSVPTLSADDKPTALLPAPPAYGYLRVPVDVPDRRARELELAVIRFAESRSLNFVSFFFDSDFGVRGGFTELVAELVRANARHVVVPSLRHLARHARLQDAMQDRLVLDAGAEVHAVWHSEAGCRERWVSGSAGADA
ncbi:hypothetical protein [Amycolatopsis vancoresmycina]|uniref:Resolvase/invertase-type recombinase catalytic domain-containing protein n=1 Tax=Amycolatopsis vancoresmycina DSM 44592 TaxID=1292037 RepID=R1FX94_9PSEU|nr:hypothetical protein [Amycolatopsis vancoresmycina]EOD63942.1 hypothetical protein H480_34290 [Amycolatopsis vancoresmycina DSM 44592]